MKFLTEILTIRQISIGKKNVNRSVWCLWKKHNLEAQFITYLDIIWEN